MSANNEQKIKVRVDLLIAQIESVKETARGEWVVDVAQYDARRTAWLKKLAKVFEDAAKECKAGTFQPSSGGYNSRQYVTLEDAAPPKPSKEFDSSQFDSDLRTLRMAADETIMVGRFTSFSHYLR